MRGAWAEGAQILLRHAVRGRTWSLVPVTVLGDTPDGAVVRISAGSHWLAPTAADGALLRLGPDRWHLAARPWTTHDLVYVVEPDRWYALGLLVLPTGRPVAWYLNFQLPARRTPWGIDTLDLELDMTAPVRAAEAVPRWRLKDAPRFRALVAAGFFSTDQLRHTVAALRTHRAADLLAEQRRELLRHRHRRHPPAGIAAAARGAGLPPDVRAAPRTPTDAIA
ncbi:DUF402 domain-containing protein [Streptomonospora sp. S1-112]|uniref:DUF402 domain-containing protein n=1 Tax=Streptomonospora mangrovi TaxID=2883123 RepID=A0A9X3NTA3_9ACTN|nr:DUF402 domain-containing protein [Streptomonospora mangrovi]MDA0563796.1 DUF402 domain-containing protein [Streptomonospora mangrovi]